MPLVTPVPMVLSVLRHPGPVPVERRPCVERLSVRVSRRS